jgi:hypothetical protein
VNTLNTIRKANSGLAVTLEKNHGIITSEDQIDELEKIDRFMLVMVRCNAGRFVCPIQDLRHFRNIIQEHGGEWIRDMSVLHNVVTQN